MHPGGWVGGGTRPFHPMRLFSVSLAPAMHHYRIHRTLDSPGGETGLQWLPLRFPGNVRIIVTATTPHVGYPELQEPRAQAPMRLPGEQAIRGHHGAAGLGNEGSPPESGENEAKYESSQRRRKVSRTRARPWPR